MASLRIVLWGRRFSVPSLQALHDQGFDIAAVYSQPDKQRGRGKGFLFTRKEKALELGIPVLQRIGCGTNRS